MESSLYDYVLKSGNPALHPDHLHRCARLWGRCYWGEQYPDLEILDDIENYRGLELLHQGIGLRYKTWKVVESNGSSDVGYTAESLFNDIMEIRNVSWLQQRNAGANALINRNIPTCFSPPNMPAAFQRAEH